MVCWKGDVDWQYKLVVKTDDGEMWAGDDEYSFRVSTAITPSDAQLQPIIEGEDKPYDLTARFTREDDGIVRGIFTFYCDTSTIGTSE